LGGQFPIKRRAEAGSPNLMPELKTFQQKPVVLCLGVMLVAALILWAQGRVWWCQAGDPIPWSWSINSSHNSQHIIDPYSFTHILHGVIEFWLLSLLFRKVPLAWRLLMAVCLEAGWEILENSAYMIEHYRAATISLNYFGDSIVNSLSDITCCGLGFVLGNKLKFWKSLALFITTEAILVLTIRDSLIINLIMLIHPIEAIKVWQMG
jgi:hypothetical protein